MKTQLVLRDRGSGRVIKRNKAKVPTETLYYAVAFGLFGKKMAAVCGGTSRDWMSFIGECAAQMLLTSSQHEIEEWLTENVLRSEM